MLCVPRTVRFGSSRDNRCLPPAAETPGRSLQEELAKEAEAGGGGRGGLVLTGPALIPQDLRFLVVYVFSAEGLPSFSAVGVPAINALVQVLVPTHA